MYAALVARKKVRELMVNPSSELLTMAAWSAASPQLAGLPDGRHHGHFPEMWPF